MKQFLKNKHVSNFMKIRSMGPELIHAEGRTDERMGGQTDRQTHGQA